MLLIPAHRTTSATFQKIIDYNLPIYALLVLIGIIVGFSIKIAGRDYQTFLVAGAVIVIVSKFGMESVTGSIIGIAIGKTVAGIFGALLTLFVPATIIVALKSVFSLTRV